MSGDDAATVNWGGTWRTPTLDEFLKLFNEKNFEWKYDDAKKGISVTSKISGYEGNSIFFLSGKYYWSSTINVNELKDAYSLYVHTEKSGSTVMGSRRWNGWEIRPVSN
ncbi:MAG TPA: hypothetical protein DD383_06990 [Rikenellaceae bacterium]|nr:hypothetical protein [Rikenellaceae bacterium]